VPKQFLEVAGLPILMHSISKMNLALPEASITLVLPQIQIEYWNELIAKFNFSVDHLVTEGGSTRTASVRNGLNAIDGDDGIVGIHDGVRPCFSLEMIQRCFSVAAEKGNSIPAVAVIPSLRKVEGDASTAVNREDYRAIQTPQCFRLSEIRKAYAEADSAHSDDASLMESFGHKMNLVEGDQNNIKVTYPLDVKLAELLLS
ncbi:MAG: 2-C-methyl-D-erythritol 4-phosphate cytidylyltransferase, partial [Bacteroidia bacterium]